MASARVEDEIAAPVEAVWACFADFGDLKAWAPGTPSVRVEGSGVGAVRFVSNPNQPDIRERLVAYDAGAHTFSYEMLESPFQFTGYVATVRLHALDATRTRIEWSSTFEPKGAPAEQVVALIENIYGMFIGKLKSTLAAA